MSMHTGLPELIYEQIRPYDGSRYTGFEELCSQLASLEPAPAGALFIRKGRGGDAGVECYLRRPDGSELGWQAKYLFSWDDSLASQLDKSLRTALDKHPALSEYIVCLPFDLSDAKPARGKSAQQKWDAWKVKWEKTAHDAKRPLSINLWSKSAISRRLASDDAAYAGRLQYWFGQEALTKDWFVAQFEKTRSALGSRYSPATNVDLPIRQHFLAFTRNPELQARLDDWCLRITEKGRSAIRAAREVAAKSSPVPNLGLLEEGIEALTTLLGVEPIESGSAYPVSVWSSAAADCVKASRDVLHWSYSLPPSSPNSTGISRERLAQLNLHGLLEVLNEIQEELGADTWQLANARAVLLVGPAGIGKSHLLADVIEHQVHLGLPAVMLLGSSFIDDEPWRQMMTQLDLPPTLQVKHFLASLDAAAQAAGVRAIVCIDALNERHGVDIWPHRLATFLKAIEPFPRVCIALSCRSTFVSHVVPDDLGREDLLRIEHQGFGANGGEAAKIYLDKRRIVRPGAPNLAPEFQNPLFLKTCCDFLEAEGKRELPRGLRGVTAIFGFYNKAVTKALTKRMKLDPHLDVVMQAINGFAQRLVMAGGNYLPKEDAVAFFESVLSSGGLLERSLLSQLESEGVLAIEPVSEEDGSIRTMVRFTFERFSDHMIATRLLDEHLDVAGIDESLLAGHPLGDFIRNQESYRFAGIIEALAIQLPERAGREIIDLGDEVAWTVRHAFLESLLWRDQSYFTDKTLALVRELCDDDEINDLLVSIATEPSNKFNALYLQGQLRSRTMPERDRLWSIYVAQNGDHNGAIHILIDWALENGMGVIDPERRALAVIILSWLLSTTNRAVRDKATKALVCLLADHLELAAALLREFSKTDDLYILERLFAAAYGAVLQGIAQSGISELAQTCYDLIFASGAPPLNILLRDHAFGLIKYVEWRGLIPNAIDMSYVNPPYRSPWPIQHVSDKRVESYKMDYGKGQRFTDPIVGSVVHDGDFARYVVDHLVDRWSPTPIGTTGFPTNFDICQGWLDEFSAVATPKQVVAFDRVVAAIQATVGQPSYAQTPERDALAKAEAAFQRILTSDAWEDYRVRAKLCIGLDVNAEWSFGRQPARFNTGWARRWICKRAHDLGWTAKRFGTFDQHRSSDRQDHRIERIGKKYQWLALRDLTARMSDNLVFVGGYGLYSDDEPRGFGSAREVGARDIDPSLLLTHTNYDGWRHWGWSWWVPVALRLRPLGPVERRAWLDGDQDVVNDASLIEVTNPKTKRRWLSLNGFGHWRQQGIEDERKEMQRETWFRLRCLVVRKKDEARLFTHLKDQVLTSPYELPTIDLHGDYYIGEYPWHPEVSRSGDWSKEADFKTLPVSVRPTVASYSCEQGGYDYSIDKTISVDLPAPWLADAMGLRLANGRELTYVDATGTVRFFDPSVAELGPQAALVDRDAFLAMLKREGLSAIWVIAGEKSVYGSPDPGRGFGGRVFHSAVYRLQNDNFVREICWKREDPSQEQLKMFFGDQLIPEGIKTRQPQSESRQTKRQRKAGTLPLP